METMMKEVAFPGYTVESNEPGAGFYSFVLAYTAFAFFLIAPLVTWSRNNEKRRFLATEQIDVEAQGVVVEKQSRNDTSPAANQREAAPVRNNNPSAVSESQGQTNVTKDSNNKAFRVGSSTSGRSGFGFLLRELDKVAAAEYPDGDPDFQSHISGQGQQTGRTVRSKVPTEHSSALPSAATTSRIHVAPSSKRLTSLVLDVGGRRWKHRRPIGRVDVIQNAINNELGTFSSNKPSSTIAGKKRTAKGMSDVASSVLEEHQSHEIPTFVHKASAFHRQQRARRRTSKAGSHSAASERSYLSSIVDDISPNDAADANDPGRGNIFLHRESRNSQQAQGVGMDSGLKLGCFTSFFEALLELAAPDEAMMRVLWSSIPLSVGAMSEAVFRLVTATFISQYLGTESMIAYLLVGLFVRLTSEELSGAIVDALSSFVQASLLSGQPDASFVAGQYVQLGIVLQLTLGVPLLVVWALTMEGVVFWLVQQRSIADIAENYARVVVFHYLVHAVSRTCTVVFHIGGHEHFESMIDFSASTLQLIVVALVVALVENSTLMTVGYIQVLIGIAGAVAKIMFPVMKGWMKPFRKGMFGNFAPIHNRRAFQQLTRATVPLFIGTVLEYGEWEVLTIFLRHLGSAEVATWALLGAVWDVLEALTEGIGEAAAIQVAFLLAAFQPGRARKLANMVIYMAVVQSLLVTSALYMSGRYLAVLFSSDPTIQHLFNDAVSLIGLANVTMSFAQVSWSLIGAQGRYRLATSVIFFSRWLITIPIALICIFAFFMELDTVCGSLVVGYASASCALTFIVLRSDWERLARVMYEMNSPIPNNDEGSFDDFDDDDSSSDGFGVDVVDDESHNVGTSKTQTLKDKPKIQGRDSQR